jgi:hypothetical protein
MRDLRELPYRQVSGIRYTGSTESCPVRLGLDSRYAGLGHEKRWTRCNSGDKIGERNEKLFEFLLFFFVLN